MSDSEVILAVIAAAVGMFIRGRLPAMLVALMVPLALFFTGILPLGQIFSGFGDTVIIFIAGLFIVAAGLEATGVTAWAGKLLARVAGSSPLRLSVFTVLVSASAAFLTPVATTSNLIVFSPGGYRFGDYWRLGLVLVAFYFVIAVSWVPLVWKP